MHSRLIEMNVDQVIMDECCGHVMNAMDRKIDNWMCGWMDGFISDHQQNCRIAVSIRWTDQLPSDSLTNQYMYIRS